MEHALIRSSARAVVTMIAAGWMMILCCGTSIAQTPGGGSPQIHADGRVTFRLQATNASQVLVSGQFQKGHVPMVRDAQGLWSVTVGPVAPDIYEYTFTVDGIQMVDPGNREVKPQRWPRTSILHIPGQPPRLHDFRPVPHGVVVTHDYHSKALSTVRKVQVYLPPGYSSRGAKFPVLFLGHGYSDCESTWVAHGKAHWILDNLIAEKKAVPMVVVMMDGHPLVPTTPRLTNYLSDNIEAYRKDLFEEVLPWVESTYRVRKDPAGRAIIGLSMGGGQSLSIGLKHPEWFSWVGGMSSAVFEPEKNLTELLAKPEAANRKFQLVWFACGKSDFLLKRNQEFDALLTQKGIRHEYHETEGDHSWPVWRTYLADFAPRLFRR